MSATVLQYVEPAVVVVLLGSFWAAGAYRRARRIRLERHARERAARAEGAAYEAAADEPAFAPDQLRETVAEVLTIAQSLWDEATSSTGAGRPDARLVTEWAGAKAGLGSGLRVEGDPRIDVLRIVNREGDQEDRAVLRVRARIRRDRRKPEYRGDLSYLEEPTTVKVDERWTLGRRAGRWLLLAVDSDPLAAPTLSAPLIAIPAQDDARLQEESLRELGERDAVGTSPAELVSPSASPAVALLDLSAVDGRFLPALLGATLARLVESWEEAGTGSPEPLLRLTTPEAARALLHPGDEPAQPKLILRDAVLARWDVVGFDATASPARVIVTPTIEAIRFVIDERTGGRIAGSATARHRICPTWTLALSDEGPSQWRLVDSSNPVDGLQYVGQIYTRDQRP